MTDDPSPPPTSVPPTSQTLATLAPVARQSVVDAVADRLRGEILVGAPPPRHAPAVASASCRWRSGSTG